MGPVRLHASHALQFPQADAAADEAVEASLEQPMAPLQVAKPDPKALKLGVAGPVSEAAPQLGVYVHALAKELAPDLVKALNQVFPGKVETSSAGYEGPQAGFSKDPNLVWVRDYLPIWVRDTEGKLKALKPSSPNKTRDGVDMSTFVPVAAPSPGQKLFRAPGQTSGGRWMPVEKLPLNLEPGNFVVSGAYALMTSKIFEDNPGKSRDAVLDTLSKATNVPRSRLIVLEPMPGEKTHHADLSVLSLGDGKVAVPEIRDEALQAITYGHEITLGTQVKAHLDKQAALLTALGLQVTRMPMMPPVYLKDGNGVFYSPANSLLMNGHAFVPTFAAPGFPDSYKQLQASYQDEWKATFTQAGFEPHLIDATECGKGYGLFRCLTSTQPE